MTAKTPEDSRELAKLKDLHERAMLDLLAKELCHKQAWKIARTTAGLAKRSDVIHRYDQIALGLYSLRRKPLSSDHAKRAKAARERFLSGVGLTNAEAKESAEFSRVENDSEAGDEKRWRAKDRLKQLWKQAEARERSLRNEWIEATCASGTLPFTVADRLLFRWNRGKKKLYWDFARTIERGCEELEKGRQLSSKHGPLLELLCVEWRRNDEALWRFLSACFRTWDDVKNNPASVLRRRILIHQFVAKHGHDANAIHANLEEVGAFSAVKIGLNEVSESRRKLINKDISRGLKRA